MKKGAWKKYIKWVVIILIVLSALGWLYLDQFYGNEKLSPDQFEIVDTLGYPDRFVVSYLPHGEGEDVFLVRNETWYYTDHQQAITFIGGDIATTQETEAEVSQGGEITYSDLTPDLFEFEMSYEDVVEKLGSAPVEKVDWLPDLYSEGEVETYISDHVIFTIEYDRLTYIETVGLDLAEEEAS